MASVTNKNGSMLLKAYRGDAKTLLAFNLSDKQSAKNLAGFTILTPAEGTAGLLHLQSTTVQNTGRPCSGSEGAAPVEHQCANS